MVYIPVLYLKNRISDRDILSRRITVGQFASNHGLDHTAFREIILSLYQCFNRLAIPDDRDGIRYIFNLIELVRNNDAGDSLLFQLKHNTQQLLALFIVQGCRRLIQNQKFYFLRHCLGNLDQLLLADTK